MNKKITTFALLLSFVGSSFTCLSNSSDTAFSENQSLLSALKISTGIVAAVAGYKLLEFAYGQCKNYVVEITLDKTVDAIALILTPNLVINHWPAKKREDALRQKARFINMRKRILAKLADRIAKPNTLSEVHQGIIRKDISHAQHIFKIVDAVRSKNPFEKEYASSSVIDESLENYIINSIILVSKPNEECTEAELIEKAEKEQRKAKIIEKLRSRVNDVVLNALVKSSLILLILSA